MLWIEINLIFSHNFFILMEYHSDIKDANFPTDAEGRTYHLDVKKGEIAPRIITCGDFERLFSIIKTPGFELKFIH